MANITISSVAGDNKYLITSNDVDTGWGTCFFWSDEIFHVYDNDSYVLLTWHDGHKWELSFDGIDNSWQVYSVLEVVITSNTQLAALISDMKSTINIGNTCGFIYDQAVASDTWEINHQLGRFPSVTIVDTSGNKVMADVQYIDANNITISFTNAFAGKAYLN